MEIIIDGIYAITLEAVNFSKLSLARLVDLHCIVLC